MVFFQGIYFSLKNLCVGLISHLNGVIWGKEYLNAELALIMLYLYNTNP